MSYTTKIDLSENKVMFAMIPTLSERINMFLTKNNLFIVKKKLYSIGFELSLSYCENTGKTSTLLKDSFKITFCIQDLIIP